jgi:GGDEF domain-containing protein
MSRIFIPPSDSTDADQGVVMVADAFMEDDFLLTPGAFEFVLNNELKRAVRSLNFLTLLLLEPAFTDDSIGSKDDRKSLVRLIAGLVGRQLRETDLLSQTAGGRLSIVLLDADLHNSMAVVERLLARLEHYGFSRPIAIKVGAACCPTHGADAESLLRAAESGPVAQRQCAARGNPPGNAANGG